MGGMCRRASKRRLLYAMGVDQTMKGVAWFFIGGEAAGTNDNFY
jgi:hypothetical protein